MESVIVGPVRASTDPERSVLAPKMKVKGKDGKKKLGHAHAR